MFSATVDNDEELKRLLAARESAGLLAKSGASTDAQSAAQTGVNQAAVDSVKLPELSFATQEAQALPAGGNVLGGLPARIGASPGVVSPGDFDVMALLEESRGGTQTPQIASPPVGAPQAASTQASTRKPLQYLESTSPQQSRQEAESKPQNSAAEELRWARKQDATMRFAQAIERAGREVASGLTFTNPNTDDLVTQEGTAEADLRALARQRMQAELDRQEAARKLLQEQNERDRIGMWGKQIDASITNAGARARMAERELAQKERDAAASRDVQAGHYRDMSEAQRNANSLGWANLKQRENESKREFELRKEKAQKGDGEGHLLPISGVEDFATGEQAAFLLGELPGKAQELNPTTIGAMLNKLPFVSTDTGKYESVLGSVTQIVGRYLEGGKMTDDDRRKYKETLPQIKDSPETLRYKINDLKKILARTAKLRAKLLQDSGYKTPSVDWADKVIEGTSPRGATAAAPSTVRLVRISDGVAKTVDASTAEKFMKAKPGEFRIE